MGPVAVGILAFVGGAVAAAVGKALTGGGKRKPKARAAPQRAAPERPLPPAVPEVEPRDFAVRWGSRFFQTLVPEGPGKEEGVESRQPPGASLSLKIATVVNWLNGPMFWSGPALLLWLLAELALRYAVSAETYAAIGVYSRPAVAVLAPMTVGYWTNWLAIKMLFRPRQKNWLWHGLVPARRLQLADEIADAVRERLISPETVREHLKESGVVRDLCRQLLTATRAVVDDAEFRLEVNAFLQWQIHRFCSSEETRERVKTVVQTTVERWAGKKFGGLLARWTKPIWGPRVAKAAEELIPEIPGAVTHAFGRLDGILDGVPRMIEERGATIEERLTDAIVAGMERIDVRSIVRRQLNKLDEGELEALLTQNMTKEMRFIQTCGGLFGVAVGAVILMPEALMAAIVLGVVCWAVFAATVEKGPRGAAESGGA